MDRRVIAAFEESAEVKKRFAEDNLERLSRFVELVSETFENGNKLLIFGNGGSAADAQHLAAEFINRFQIERPPLPAIALTTDTSILTSIGNDYDFSDIFVKQVKALGKAGDLAIGISTSGESENVLKGLQAAAPMGIGTVGLTGKDGGRIAKSVDLSLNVQSDSTPRIQETHITICHVLCNLVDRRLFGPSSA